MTLTEAWVSLSAMLYEQGQSFIGGELGIDPNPFDRSQPKIKDHYNVIW